MPQPTMTAPLTGCVTIDSNAPDGYLGNARAGNPTAGANTNTEAAVENWLAQQAAHPTWTTASLVGHGASGIIETGSAQNQNINLANQATWTPLLQRLQGKFTSLYLYGAAVGAGEEGALLLFTIARAAGAAVYGPTGVIYCNSHGDFVLESGAVWQMATPNTRPAPIEPPQLSERPAEGGTSGPGVQAGQATAQTQTQTSWDQPPQAPGEPGCNVTRA